ncbi:hypothetical protein MBANPS3_002240 [Mucor bainieri]
MDNFAQLSKEAQLLVFSQLSFEQKLKCILVSKAWHRLITDNVLYQQVKAYKNNARLSRCVGFFRQHQHLGQQTQTLVIHECNITFDTLLMLPDLFPNVKRLEFISPELGGTVGEKGSSPNIKKFREQMQKWTQIDSIWEVNSKHPIITSALLLKRTKLKFISLQQTTNLVGVLHGSSIHDSAGSCTGYLLERKRLFMDNLANAPMLKSLVLTKASLRPTDLADLNKYCPNLQVLRLRGCYLNICSNFPLTQPETPSAAKKFVADDKSFVNTRLKSLLIDVHPRKSRPEFEDQPNFAWLNYIRHHYQNLTSFEFVCRMEEKAQLKVPPSRVKAYNDLAALLLSSMSNDDYLAKFQLMHWPPCKRVQHRFDSQRRIDGYKTIYLTKQNIQRRMTNLAKSRPGRHVHHLHIKSADGVLDYGYKKAPVTQQEGNDSSAPIDVDQEDSDVLSSSDEEDFDLDDEYGGYESATTEEDPDWLDYKYERKMRHRQRIRFIRKACAGYGTDDDDPLTMDWNSDTDSSMSDHDPFTSFMRGARDNALDRSLVQSLGRMTRLNTIFVECLNGSCTEIDNISKALNISPNISQCTFDGLAVKCQPQNTTTTTTATATATATSNEQGQQDCVDSPVPPYTRIAYGYCFSNVKLLRLYRCIVENDKQIQHVNVVLNDVLRHCRSLETFYMSITRKQQQQQQPSSKADDRSRRLSINFQKNSILKRIEFNATQTHPLQPYAMYTSNQQWHYFMYQQNTKTFASISRKEFARAPQLHVEILLPKQPVMINSKLFTFQAASSCLNWADTG